MMPVGSGSGYGSGYGDGFGYGSGYGDGDGSGYGSGYGDGYGYGTITTRNARRATVARMGITSGRRPGAASLAGLSSRVGGDDL